MIDYGCCPEDDELEITIFGPGFGEAIAVHVGEQNWLLVDSCIEPESKSPATYLYLQHLGVPAQDVKAIVASHWHDDHVRGISVLAAHYPEADFILSSVFNDGEATTFLSAHSDSASELTRGTKELFTVIKQHEKVFYVQQRSIVMDVNANNQNVRIVALSPVPSAFAQSIAHFAQYIPKVAKRNEINHAPELRPNLEAVVIHIDFGGEAALLGSDLEDHASFGWTAIVTDKWCSQRAKSSAFKVAHHGSVTGNNSQVWTTLLTDDPVACITPFNLGNQKLPTDADKQRIKQQISNAYLTSGASKQPDLVFDVRKRLGDVCKKLTTVNAGFGAIRLRKKIGTPSWNVELFGNACNL